MESYPFLHPMRVQFNPFKQNPQEIWITSFGDGIRIGIDQVTDVSSAGFSVSGLEMKAFPNPFNDFLQVEIISEYSGDCTLELIDISGNRIFENFRKLEKGKNNFALKTPDLLTGSYILRAGIFGNQGVKKQKIIIVPCMK
ncbi:MAG: T9SS type A sorting domain-containing protein [Bacteroidetes bacterium]|nr:T9SS type A sorting domain-containing protein [Bacteroidota bacterium]